MRYKFGSINAVNFVSESHENNFGFIFSFRTQETKLHTFLLHKVVEPAENKEFQSLLASFRASGGMLKKKTTSKILHSVQTFQFQINRIKFSSS